MKERGKNEREEKMKEREKNTVIQRRKEQS